MPLHFDGGNYHGGVKVNAHPPAAVLLALPFAHLNYRDALLAWNLASLALLAASVWMLLTSRELHFSTQSRVVIASLLLVCNPLAQQVNQGQLNLVILFLLAGGWRLMASGKNSLAGTVLGVATAIKLFPGFVFLFFLAERRIRPIAWGIVSFLAVNVLAGAALGFESFHAYVFEALPQLREFDERWTNVSAASYWSKNLIGARGHVTAILPQPWLAHLATLSSVLGVIGAIFFCPPREGKPPQRNLSFALVIVGMLIVSPITWNHYLILLLLPLLILWTHTTSTRCRVAAAVLIVALGIDPFWIWNTLIGFGEFDPTNMPNAAQTITLISFQSYALAALFLLLLSISVSAHPRTARTPPQPENNRTGPIGGRLP